MLRMLLSILLWFVFAFSASAAASDEKRMALVIGNSEYQSVAHLPNPRNDARDLGAMLTRMGFEVTEGLDLDFRSMRLVIRDFADAAEDADVVLVYYAGHGIEVENTNYLIPVNAELRRDRDVEFEAIRLDSVLSSIETSDGLKIVLLDACRNNPFAVQMSRQARSRSIGRGLARIEPSGMLVGYAAKGGTVALDGEGRNSPYAAALLEHMDEPGLELGKLFRKVRDTVFEDTDGVQEPFVYGSLPGRDIFLTPAAPEKPAPELAVLSPAPVPKPPIPDDVKSKMMKDYAAADQMNSLRRWSKFLQDYGDQTGNPLVELAAQRRDLLAIELDIERGYIIGQKGLAASLRSRDAGAGYAAEEMRLIQTALNMMGFDTGGIDGKLGPRTRQAIASAREKAQLSRGTEIDEALLRVLPNVAAVLKLQSDKAVVYEQGDIPAELEPRLRKALLALQGRRLIFDYFQGRLYLAVKRSFADSRWVGKTAAAKKAGGHLVTVGSAQENDFVVSLFSRDPTFIEVQADGTLRGPSIGLYRPIENRARGGPWVWENDEPLRYQAWGPGRPGNGSDLSNYTAYWRPMEYSGSATTVRFWDRRVDGYSTGYIVEIQ